MDSSFNAENSTKENIDLIFKNVNALIELKIYSEYKQLFEYVLVKIRDILSKYVNNGNLSTISIDYLNDIKFDLIDLDTETKSLKSYFAEWSLLWLESIISLRISEIKIGGVNNGC